MKNLKTKLVVAFGAVAASATSFAADYTTEITAASTEGAANVSGATVAVIGLALIGFGVGAVVAWMRK